MTVQVLPTSLTHVADRCMRMVSQKPVRAENGISKTSESNISPACMSHLDLAGENVVLFIPKCHVATSARRSCGDSGARERVTGTTLHVSFCQVKLRG